MNVSIRREFAPDSFLGDSFAYASDEEYLKAKNAIFLERFNNRVSFTQPNIRTYTLKLADNRTMTVPLLLSWNPGGIFLDEEDTEDYSDDGSTTQAQTGSHSLDDPSRSAACSSN